MTITEIQTAINKEKWGDLQDFLQSIQTKDVLSRITFTHAFFKWFADIDDTRTIPLYGNWITYLTWKYYTPTTEEANYLMDRLLDPKSVFSYRAIFSFFNNEGYMPKGCYQHLVEKLASDYPTEAFGMLHYLQFDEVKVRPEEIDGTWTDEASELIKNWTDFNIITRGISLSMKDYKRRIVSIGYGNLAKIIGKTQTMKNITKIANSVRMRKCDTMYPVFTKKDVFEWIEFASKNPSDLGADALLLEIDKYFSNPDLELTDEDIEKIIELNNEDINFFVRTRDLVRRFTKKQFKALTKNTMPPDFIVITKDGNLDDYVQVVENNYQKRPESEVFEEGSERLTRLKRWKDDEIHDYPFCFQIENIVDSGLYISEETLEALKKHWNITATYMYEFHDFTKLFRDNQVVTNNGFNKEYFFYLLKMTKPTNWAILESLRDSKIPGLDVTPITSLYK